MKKKYLLSCALIAIGTNIYAQDVINDSVRYDQYGVEVKRVRLSAEARNGIMVVESHNQDYRLWLDLRVEADGATYFGEDKDYNPIGNGTRIRRARFAVKTLMTRDWYGELDVDFAGGNFELKDAIIRYIGLNKFEFQAGNFKENFSQARNTTSRYLQLMERPMVANALAPSRQLGINAKYQYKWLYSSLGAFTQSVDNSETSTYVDDDNKKYGHNQGYDITGKMIFQPLYFTNKAALHLGAGLSYRTPKTDVDPSEYKGSRFSVRNGSTINRKKYLDTDVIPNVHHNLLYTFEIAGAYQGYRIESAFMQNDTHIDKNAPSDVNQSTKHFLGKYIQVSKLLFGGEQRYDYNGGKFTQPTRGRKWGDIELAFRYDYLNLNSQDIYGGSAEAYTIGLNYYLNNNAKIMINYQYNNNDRYANGKGKYYTGHDASGKPTADYTKIVEGKNDAGVDYSMLAIRFALAF